MTEHNARNSRRPHLKIAIDFDGTIVRDNYPSIGKEIPFATETLRCLMRDGHKLILWTVRTGQLLEEAVNWCRERGVEFYAVNRDYPEEREEFNEHYSRKIKADIFIDDRNIGGLLSWGELYTIIKENISISDYCNGGVETNVSQVESKRGLIARLFGK